jgi:hypothetical protein
MNELERFVELAIKAHGEPAPAIDVTARVLRDIRQAVGGEGINPPLLIFSGLSLLAASIVAVLAIQSWEVLADPLSGLFDSLTMVMQ